ncbi:hypothetical protein C8R45DRAFT_947780 [Mycena sanguinolenta]|nr:hypothetical protein C8R45DRAFT_947780 [Mycena sanguinolenta]
MGLKSIELAIQNECNEELDVPAQSLLRAASDAFTHTVRQMCTVALYAGLRFVDIRRVNEQSEVLVNRNYTMRKTPQQYTPCAPRESCKKRNRWPKRSNRRERGDNFFSKLKESTKNQRSGCSGFVRKKHPERVNPKESGGDNLLSRPVKRSIEWKVKRNSTLTWITLYSTEPKQAAFGGLNAERVEILKINESDTSGLKK